MVDINTNILICGPKLCGKTSLINNIAEKHQGDVYVNLGEEYINGLYTKQVNDRKQGLELDNIIFVFENYTQDELNEFYKNDTFRKLIINGRHLNITNILVFTEYMYINVLIRAQLDYLVMFSCKPETVELVYEKIITKHLHPTDADGYVPTLEDFIAENAIPEAYTSLVYKLNQPSCNLLIREPLHKEDLNPNVNKKQKVE
jgi:GTPase SAR1 family protein